LPRCHSLVLGLSLVCSLALAARTGALQDDALHAQLLRLSQRRIFFGQQSVGVNLLEGVREIAERFTDVRLNVAEVPGNAALAATFAHPFIPENGNPALKLQSFERALCSGIGSGADVAFLKFCYADFSPGTDARGLFARYQATLSAAQQVSAHDLRARHRPSHRRAGWSQGRPGATSRARSRRPAGERKAR